MELCLLQRWGRSSWQQAQNIHTQQHALQSHSWKDDAGGRGVKEGCLDHRASGLEGTAPVEFGGMARGVSGRGQGQQPHGMSTRNKVLRLKHTQNIWGDLEVIQGGPGHGRRQGWDGDRMISGYAEQRVLTFACPP